MGAARVLSRFGSRIAVHDKRYISRMVGSGAGWRTDATVMANAGALSWIDQRSVQSSRRVLFSGADWRGGSTLGVFTATETRAPTSGRLRPGRREWWHGPPLVPLARPRVSSDRGDGHARLAGRAGSFLFNGSLLPGTPIGPPRSQCTDAAWSPDRRVWIWTCVGEYRQRLFSAIWRQRFPNGEPEQVTFGATEEQDRVRSRWTQALVALIGESQSTLWVHAGDTCQVTFEAYMPSFAEDGNRLYYLQRTKADRRFVSGELWTIDLKPATRERLPADSPMEHYDVSRDVSHRVAFIGVDASGRSSVWEASLDGSGAAPARPKVCACSLARRTMSFSSAV